MFFCSAISSDAAVEAAVQIRGGHELELWDPKTGETGAARRNARTGAGRISHAFSVEAGCGEGGVRRGAGVTGHSKINDHLQQAGDFTFARISRGVMDVLQVRFR